VRERIRKARKESRHFKGKQEGGRRATAIQGRRKICKAIKEDACHCHNNEENRLVA
jgi:hypothetical protein